MLFTTRHHETRWNCRTCSQTQNFKIDTSTCVVFSLLHICTHKLTYSCTYIHVLYIDRFFLQSDVCSWFSFLFFLVCLFYAYCCGLSLNPGFWGMRIWDHQSMPQTFKFFKFVMNLNGGCKFIDDLHGGFLKWWYPTTIGFSTKMTILGCEMGVPPFKETPKSITKHIPFTMIESFGKTSHLKTSLVT